MAKKLTISFILDETGSMNSVKHETINGFNEYIETLQKDKDSKDARFTLTKFNSEKIEIVHDGVKMKDAKLLTDETYQPNSLTPLYDAIGKTVNSIGKKEKNVLVVIQTDGLENDSQEFDRDKIFKLIEKKKKQGWTFAFMGADQDAWETGKMLGISKGNVLSYTSADTGKTMRKAAAVSVAYASTGGAQTDSLFATVTDEDSGTAK